MSGQVGIRVVHVYVRVCALGRASMFGRAARAPQVSTAVQLERHACMSVPASSRYNWAAERPAARSAAVTAPADAPAKRLIYGMMPASSSALIAPG